MTQPQTVVAETCDQFLRQGRELLAQGDLASASAAGWRAALQALEAYAGDAVAESDFRDTARRLVKDSRGSAKAAEWMVSSIALSDNIHDNWLDADGVARRLDDVQRLTLLVKDIAEPPQSADDLLRRAWECLNNGALTVASENGWEAITHAAKTYAEVMGHDHIRSNHLDQVTPLLMKEPRGYEAGAWSLEAFNLLENTAPGRKWLDAQWVSRDLDVAEKLVTLMGELMQRKTTNQARRCPNSVPTIA